MGRLTNLFRMGQRKPASSSVSVHLAPESEQGSAKNKRAESLSLICARHLESILTDEVALWASNIKTMLQMLIGIGLVGAIFIRLLHDLGVLGPPSLDNLSQASILSMVGDALLISSAVELAYTLFTPSLDEAVNPLITGLAAIILLGIAQVNYQAVSHIDEMTRTVGILVIVLAVLFWIKKRFIDDV